MISTHSHDLLLPQLEAPLATGSSQNFDPHSILLCSSSSLTFQSNHQLGYPPFSRPTQLIDIILFDMFKSSYLSWCLPHMFYGFAWVHKECSHVLLVKNHHHQMVNHQQSLLLKSQFLLMTSKVSRTWKAVGSSRSFSHASDRSKFSRKIHGKSCWLTKHR